MADRRRLRRIRDKLRREYGRPILRPHGAPIDELILTVLSQNTNDRNRDVAYGRLRERFASWDEVRDAPVEEIEDAIRPGGLAPTKAVRIKQILEAIGEDDLVWLKEAPLDEARDYLTSLPGVGRKTAACVLLFAFGRPDVPVDTHVYRVGSRLGLWREKASFTEAPQPWRSSYIPRASKSRPAPVRPSSSRGDSGLAPKSARPHRRPRNGTASAIPPRVGMGRP